MRVYCQTGLVHCSGHGRENPETAGEVDGINENANNHF